MQLMPKEVSIQFALHWVFLIFHFPVFALLSAFFLGGRGAGKDSNSNKF